MTLEKNGVEGVFVVPDLVQFIPLVGKGYTDLLASLGFNWKRLAGARVLAIEGKSPYAYADFIAATQSGNYLDHGVRVNSVFSSYRISGNDFSQRFGDIGGPVFPDLQSLTMTLQLVNSTKSEKVTIPFVSSFGGAAFKNGAD